MIKYIKRIRDLREDSDRTQQQVADILGTSQTMYARYERGANELPIHHLLTLCDLYGVTADYILGRSDHREPSELPTNAASFEKPITSPQKVTSTPEKSEIITDNISDNN